MPTTKSPAKTRRATDASMQQAWALVRQLLIGGEMAERMTSLSRDLGVAPGAIKALLALRRGGYLSMRDIARGLGCDPSYVTGLVDELAEHGLVERHSHAGDRRIKTVVLTASGERAADRVERSFSVPPASFRALSQHDLESLTRILSKLASG